MHFMHFINSLQSRVPIKVEILELAKLLSISIISTCDVIMQKLL